MAGENYKIAEDKKQEQYLELYGGSYTKDGYVFHILTSCRHLSRRFIHSENRYAYLCACDEVEVCPKSSERGKATKSCLTDPYTVLSRFSNDDEGDAAEK